MEKVLSITLMEVSMKESGKRITNTDTVFSLLKMALNMSVHLRMTECSKDKFHRKKLIKLLFSNKMI